MSVTSTAPSTTKGARYLQQLDQALCNGDWSSVPELARKTEKHASVRRCFTLAARSTAQIASSSAVLDTSAVDELTSKLTTAISAEERYPEDAYAAEVCLAEIYFQRKDYEAVLNTLPRERLSNTSLGSRAVALGWLEVCEVKASLLRALTLEALARHEEARRTCLDAAARTPGSRTPQLRLWTERLLAMICTTMSQRTSSTSLQSLSQALRCFMSWSDFWQRSSQSSTSTAPEPSSHSLYSSHSRRRIWRTYYELLSLILQRGLIYNPAPSSSSDLLLVSSEGLTEEDYITSRVRQKSALRRAETAYESLLLHETQFPKASESNTEVEEWVQQVTTNWKILSGPDWTDSELGDDEKETLDRGVLDVLYRAATKTFHSTPILRHLFTVHAAVGEFELAMHAFNSYVEIIGKGKARAEKTGNREIGFDTDDTAITTAAEAVRLLCRYGDREQGEKAIDVGKTIEKWLNHGRPSSTNDAKTNSDDNRTQEDSAPSRSTESRLESKTLAAAYRAIGTARAHWARLTYDSASRSGLQADALGNLRIAQTHDESSIETAYALALLLAETRNVSESTRVIKYAIASSSQPAESEDEDDEVDEPADLSRKTALIPLWHLLGLCLTARDEYEQGIKMCEAAFEQFGDENVLFGDAETRTSDDSEKASLIQPKKGLVDALDGLEREDILQIKMSQVTYVELTEGTEAALEMSHELLSLYARLFGNPELYHVSTQKPPPTAVSAAPSKLGGTLRSIAGSIRPRSARHGVEKDPREAWSVPLSKRGTAADTAPNGESPSVPIAITVTDEDGVRTEKSHHHYHHHMHLPFHKRARTPPDSRPAVQKKRSFRMESRRSPLAQTIQTQDHSSTDGEAPATKPAMEPSISSDAIGTPDQPLNQIDHNIPHDAMPPPPGHEEQPPRQDVRLPAPDPASRLIPNTRPPSAQDRQQTISLLLKIWLFIAGLYLRTDVLDDAASAMNEASKLVESFEAEVGSERSSARRFFEKGWGGGKSVDALWADVFSARGYLALARELPFEAIPHFEQALAHFPDHADAIVGLSNLLMDIFEEKLPAEEPRPPLSSQHSPSSSSINAGIPPAPQPPLESKDGVPPKETTAGKTTDNPTPVPKRPTKRDLTPAELNRLAARDRAYLLLSNLTRLGHGWDNSEAWYTLARAYELSKQLSKAKQALWWVVELEDNQPMRPWREVGGGGFTL